MYKQIVDKNSLYNAPISKSFAMIDNYIYLYHTDTLIALPVYPESITDTMDSQFSPHTPMSRSAPIYSFVSSGPRSMQITLPLHRDMMNQINSSNSKLNVDIGDDYVDYALKQLQSAALPSYAASQKMVNPPIVAIRFGNTIFCKGVVSGGVSVTYSGPIISSIDGDQYAMATVSFTINEVDPYDANIVAVEGGYRGIRTSLERNIYKSSVGGNV